MWWGGLGLIFGAGLLAGLALAQPAEAEAQNYDYGSSDELRGRGLDLRRRAR
jgi:hypothetical protein